MKKNNITIITLFLACLTGYFFTPAVQAMKRSDSIDSERGSDASSYNDDLQELVSVLPIPVDQEHMQNKVAEVLQAAQARDRQERRARRITTLLLRLLAQEVAECLAEGSGLLNIIEIQIKYNELLADRLPDYFALPKRCHRTEIDQLLIHRVRNVERLLASIDPDTLQSEDRAFELVLKLALQGDQTVYNTFCYANPDLYNVLYEHISPEEQARLDEWYDAYFPTQQEEANEATAEAAA